jgi:uncharacterized protein DUF4397
VNAISIKKLAALSSIVAVTLAALSSASTGVANPAVTSPAVANSAVVNPAVTSPAVADPAVTSPAVANPATATGYLRLAHLSPDAPAVDVYLTAVSGSLPRQVFPAVGYGVVSPYLPVPAGTYTIAMRWHGAQPTSLPVLSATVTVVPGDAYTVAGVGRYADLGLRVIADDLSMPSQGSARVRVVQASARDPLLKVSVGADQVIADQVAFATTTDYLDISAGQFSLQLQPLPAGVPVQIGVALSARGVYSLFVIDGANDTLAADLRTDATNGSVVPAGAVATGGGGMDPADVTTRPWLFGGAAAALIVLAGFVMDRRRRPAVSHW